MWAKILKTLEEEPPPNNMAMQSRKLVQVLVTTAFVPICFASTEGLSALQMWQKLKRSSSCDKNTMCFGSVLKLVPAVVSL